MIPKEMLVFLKIENRLAPCKVVDCEHCKDHFCLNEKLYSNEGKKTVRWEACLQYVMMANQAGISGGWLMRRT